MAAVVRRRPEGNDAGSGGACCSPSTSAARRATSGGGSAARSGEDAGGRRARPRQEHRRHLIGPRIEDVVRIVEDARLVESGTGGEQRPASQPERPHAADAGVIVTRGDGEPGVVGHRVAGRLRRRSRTGMPPRRGDGAQHDIGQLDEAPAGDVEAPDDALAVLVEVGVQGGRRRRRGPPDVVERRRLDPRRGEGFGDGGEGGQRRSRRSGGRTGEVGERLGRRTGRARPRAAGTARPAGWTRRRARSARAGRLPARRRRPRHGRRDRRRRGPSGRRPAAARTEASRAGPELVEPPPEVVVPHALLEGGASLSVAARGTRDGRG